MLQRDYCEVHVDQKFFARAIYKHLPHQTHRKPQDLRSKILRICGGTVADVTPKLDTPAAAARQEHPVRTEIIVVEG